MTYLIGIDIGGTFTDVVVVRPGHDTRVFKAFSRPGAEAEGVSDALVKAAAADGIGVDELLSRTSRLVHGSTIAANALIERTGARTAFISTKGFRDTLVLRRMLRPNMYDIRASVPPHLISRRRILEAPERIDRGGAVIEPLSDEAVSELVEQLAALDVEAVGVSLLFSFRNPSHERRLRDAILARWPNLFVAISSDVAPEIRDYERASTTLLSAYLGPGLVSYLRELDGLLRSGGLTTEMQIMRSNGGVATIEEAVAQPVDMLLSGPAGGVVAALAAPSSREEGNAVSLDMGGTSCDVSVIREGRTTTSTFLPQHSRFEGWDVLRPFLDIHALGAGGGSIAWVDRAGGLHVGPQSAGASPGPVCYRRGGVDPTVTDADLVLGYLDPECFLDREVTLDVAAAEAALGHLGNCIGLSASDVAAGVFRIVNAGMADGIRLVLADRGFDAREFGLVAFGGAGGIHGSAVMREIGVRRMVVPREAPAFSAYGLLLSDLKYDFVTSVMRRLSELDAQQVDVALRELEDAGRQAIGSPGASGNGLQLERSVDARYVGQVHEIRVPLPAAVERVDEIRSAYERAYRTAYGYLSDAELIQVVNLRVSAVAETVKPLPAPSATEPRALGEAARGERRMYFHEAGGWQSTPIVDGQGLAPGAAGAGPCVIELPMTSVVVRPGQRVAVDAWDGLLVSEEDAQ